MYQSIEYWYHSVAAECSFQLDDLRQHIHQEVGHQLWSMKQYFEHQLNSRDQQIEQLAHENSRLKSSLNETRDELSNVKKENTHLQKSLRQAQDTRRKEDVYELVVSLKEMQSEAARSNIQKRRMENEIEYLKQILKEKRLEKEAISAELAATLRSHEHRIRSDGRNPFRYSKNHDLVNMSLVKRFSASTPSSPHSQRTTHPSAWQHKPHDQNDYSSVSRALHQLHQVRVLQGSVQEGTAELSHEVGEFSQLVSDPSTMVVEGDGERAAHRMRKYLTSKLQAIDEVMLQMQEHMHRAQVTQGPASPIPSHLNASGTNPNDQFSRFSPPSVSLSLNSVLSENKNDSNSHNLCVPSSPYGIKS